MQLGTGPGQGTSSPSMCTCVSSKSSVKYPLCGSSPGESVPLLVDTHCWGGRPVARGFHPYCTGTGRPFITVRQGLQVELWISGEHTPVSNRCHLELIPLRFLPQWFVLRMRPLCPSPQARDCRGTRWSGGLDGQTTETACRRLGAASWFTDGAIGFAGWETTQGPKPVGHRQCMFPECPPAADARPSYAPPCVHTERRAVCMLSSVCSYLCSPGSPPPGLSPAAVTAFHLASPRCSPLLLCVGGRALLASGGS